MEGGDEIRKEYKRERIPWGEGREKDGSNKNGVCNHIQRIYTRTDILGLCPRRFSLN